MGVDHTSLFKETTNQYALFPNSLDDQHDLLHSLFIKERETTLPLTLVSFSRKQAVEWILRVNSHHGFSALTAILAVNFLDRFLFNFQSDHKPWMMQLVAVASLSLAAKVEETHVPLLLDFQVEDATYLFEAKTIQRMELLILSTLKWRMNPVTPLSFLDHIVTRLRALNNHNHWEYLRSCENLILSLIADSRFVGYLPSVLAAATILHVMDQVEVESNNAIHCKNHILSDLQINTEEVDECYKQISHVILQGKQKQRSSSGVMMSSSSESSNNSWEVDASSPHHTIFSRRGVEQQQMKLPSSTNTFSRTF